MSRRPPFAGILAILCFASLGLAGCNRSVAPGSAPVATAPAPAAAPQAVSPGTTAAAGRGLRRGRAG